MKVVVDANIIIAMLVASSRTVDVFFSNVLSFYVPGFLFTEIKNNMKEIIEKSRLNRKQFNVLYRILKNNLTIVSETEFNDFKEEAEKISPDPKDTIYFALALYLDCPIWSNEKRLKRQDYVKIYATHDLIKKLGIY